MIEAVAEGQVDPVLKPLEGRLKKVFSGYNGFKLLASKDFPLKEGKPGTVSLPNGDNLLLTFDGVEEAYIRMQLEIPSKLKTSLRVKNGGTFFQAGMTHGEGTLVIAISPVIEKQ